MPKGNKNPHPLTPEARAKGNANLWRSLDADKNKRLKFQKKQSKGMFLYWDRRKKAELEAKKLLVDTEIVTEQLTSDSY